MVPLSSPQDPSGAFTRTWVPELAELPTKYLLAPWTAPQQVLDRAGVQLGRTYPQRIITTDFQVRRSPPCGSLSLEACVCRRSVMGCLWMCMAASDATATVGSHAVVLWWDAWLS